MKFKKNSSKDKAYSWEGKHILIGAYLERIKEDSNPKIKFALYHYGLKTKPSLIGYCCSVKQAEEIINRIYCLGKFKEEFDVPPNKAVVKMVMKKDFVDID